MGGVDGAGQVCSSVEQGRGGEGRGVGRATTDIHSSSPAKSHPSSSYHNVSRSFGNLADAASAQALGGPHLKGNRRAATGQGLLFRRHAGGGAAGRWQAGETLFTGLHWEATGGSRASIVVVVVCLASNHPVVH